MSISHSVTVRRNEKLMAVVMVVCTLVIVCTGMIVIFRGQTAYLKSVSANLSTLAEMVAVNSKAIMAFRDTSDAEAILSTLKNEPSIVTGSIRNRWGQMLAVYYRDDNADQGDQQADFMQSSRALSLRGDLLTVIKVIILDGEVIGTVRLRAELSPMFVMLKRDTTMVVVLLLFMCWGFMLFIYSMVKKSIEAMVGSAGSAGRTQMFVDAEG